MYVYILYIYIYNVGLLVENKNMFENNSKCRVNATYRPTSIDIYNRTGVYTIKVIRINKYSLNIAPSSEHRGPSIMCKMSQVAKG